MPTVPSKGKETSSSSGESGEEEIDLDDVIFEKITDLGSLKKGDQLMIEGKFGALYNHHAIFLGLEKGVAEFDGTTIFNAKLQLEGMSTFWDRDEALIRVNYKDGKCLPSEEVVKRATDMVENRDKWDDYHFISNNCEHFAMWCKTGKRASLQVSNALQMFLTNIRISTGDDKLVAPKSTCCVIL